MKPNDCIVINEGQDTFKCVLDGQEFSMTHEQLNTLNTLYNQANNIFTTKATTFKCAYVSENEEIKILYN